MKRWPVDTEDFGSVLLRLLTMAAQGQLYGHSGDAGAETVWRWRLTK